MENKLYHFPRIEVSTVKFLLVRLGKVNIQRLALIDERTTVGGHLDDCLLRYFPHCLVQTLYLIGNAINSLLTHIHISQNSFIKTLINNTFSWQQKLQIKTTINVFSLSQNKFNDLQLQQQQTSVHSHKNSAMLVPGLSHCWQLAGSSCRCSRCQVLSNPSASDDSQSNHKYNTRVFQDVNVHKTNGIIGT